MQFPEIPESDPARVMELHSFDVLDTPADPRFDDISELARRVAGTDIAIISLVDEDRQWFKSCVGAPLGQQDTPRTISFCGHTILCRDPFIVPDTLEDDRFADNPLVIGELGVRFYAGFPLISPNGFALGSLCAISRQPHQLMEHQIDSLQRLASITVQLLDGLRQASVLSRTEEGLKAERLRQRLPSDELSSLQLLASRDQLLQMLELNLSMNGGLPFALLRCRFRDYDRVNATLGGVVAEEFMNEGARRALAAVPKGSSIARFTDAELLVLLPFAVQHSDVQRIAERLIGFCNQIYRSGSQTLPLGMSIGIAIHSGNYASVEALLADTSMALRMALRSSSNTFRFIDAEARSVARESYRLESDLREALNSRALETYLQPIVDLADGSPIGFEALARWPRGSQIVSPGTFMPMLNDSGITGELDLLIIEQALAAVPLLAQPIPQRQMTMSVNLSGILLEDDELRSRLLQLIDSNVLPSGWTLQVELLEDAFQDSTDAFEHFLMDLVERGVAIAIDDFGTGYSSLARLISLPLQGVKVDRAFVMRLEEQDDSPRTLLRTMLTMLNDLGLAITAEGVETEAQKQWLAANGVRRAQGYLFHRPIQVSEAIHLLQELDYRPSAIPVSSRRLSAVRRRQRRFLWPWPLGDRRRSKGRPDQ
ncbi:sensor domain-containing phosphodiesterase [Cyanobium sp. T1B-Tous]|uniref:sensor domain-containing diguanylate cyclase n=1 Tax=Cyanobium sp. T1B-Tous TaxID=2823721 RepID=UPI0020CDA18E|nr:sensor domain-containing phosphodiesterase [Cyanobium sp. T1B-Tous]MCP9805312.1 sensor domain-containing phosphodiesterase [Cyanobium sp. T1B-Tous]